MASKYRMIACSVSDYKPAEMTIEKIRELDESEQEYFIIEESDFLHHLKVSAIEICADWWDSQIGLMEDNCDKDKMIELIKILLRKTTELAQMKIGDTVTDVCSMNDWIRIEEV